MNQDQLTSSPASHESNDLPLTVWLKGNEPQFQDFSLSAEQTMDLLGIRRSRLTQISGKELRVARKRDGRYIRPFYRLDDVESYKNWVRTPLSQAKPAQIIEATLGKISQERENWQDRINSMHQKIISLEQLATADRNFIDTSFQILGHQMPLLEDLALTSRKNKESISCLRKQLEEIKAENQVIKCSLSSSILIQREMEACFRELTEQFKSEISNAQNLIGRLTEMTGTQMQELRNSILAISSSTKKPNRLTQKLASRVPSTRKALNQDKKLTEEKNLESRITLPARCFKKAKHLAPRKKLPSGALDRR